jgi:hypothetical protein
MVFCSCGWGFMLVITTYSDCVCSDDNNGLVMCDCCAVFCVYRFVNGCAEGEE